MKNIRKLNPNLCLRLALALLTILINVVAAQAATITVTNTNDSGAGSLRDAIWLAAPGDTINFNLTGCPCTITLTTGELVINKDLIINGPGASLLTISGNNASRVFFINPGAAGATAPPSPPYPTVGISNLTIANGTAQGGDGGNPFSGYGGKGGGGAGMGGAVFINGGAVTIDRVTFSGNQAVGGDGADASGVGTGQGGGGGGAFGNAGDSGGTGGNLGGVGGGAGVSEGASGSNGGEGGGGGGAAATRYPTIGGNGGGGGFGGGGGGGGDAGGVDAIVTSGSGGNGGFGGGGGGGGGMFTSGATVNNGGSGGTFGGSGGNGLFRQFGGRSGAGGGGGGLGGAIFVRLGSLTLINNTFTNNSAEGGFGGFNLSYPGVDADGGDGQGKGGAIFVNAGAAATACTPSFSGNTATDAAGSGTDTNDVYGILGSVVCNSAPVANNDSYSVNEDAALNVSAAGGVIFNDADAENNALTATLVSAPANAASFNLNSDGSFGYAPNPNFNGGDSFTYRVSDGSSMSNTATVTITVNAVNDNPDAVNDSATVAEDSGATTINVRANDDIAPDVGETLTVSSVAQGANGTVAVTGGGTTVSYAPNANFFGADSFTYTVSDGNGGSDTATVQITVSAVNDAPVAVNDSATVAEDSGATAINVLANDTALPDTGEILTIAFLTPPANGTLGFANGITSYTPIANFFGTDSFTYTISDGNGGSDTATVNVTVTAVNDAPTITAASALSRQQGAAGAVSNIAIVADMENAAGDLTVTATSIPAGITVSNITNTNGTITAAVSAACNAALGANTVGLKVTDGGLMATASLTVNVTASTPPVITLRPPLSPFPNNHKYTTVQISQMLQSATDGCDGNVAGSVVIEKVTSDEADDAPGDSDGNTRNDIVIGANCKSVQLRAERDGNRNGRVYIVTLRVTDSSGNTVRADYKVNVPLSQNGAPAIRDAPVLTVNGTCP